MKRAFVLKLLHYFDPTLQVKNRKLSSGLTLLLKFLIQGIRTEKKLK